jgi:hypothetical protein
MAAGVESVFVTPGSEEVGGLCFEIHGLSVNSANQLSRTLENTKIDTLLIHFSGYGFDKLGLCWWLVQGLQNWKEKKEGRRIITIFHEVYASGPIWRRSFWTAGQQREIAHKLAAQSDVALVTSEGGRAQLQALRQSLPVSVQPVFSNVGELSAPAPFYSRQPTAVVFGQGPQRKRLYRSLTNMRRTVAAGLRRHNIERILDIGQPIDIPNDVLGLPVERLGRLGEVDVSHIFAEARIGLVDYPHHVMTKSGIVAAYFAHQILAVNTSNCGNLPNDLAEGQHFISAVRLSDTSVDLEAVAAAGFSWYRKHGLKETALRILSLFS